ncbi:MAG TPA: adenine deaminase C-terminal domain-containing protein [Syntrophorhabdaceae bacterium]|nr:adenine deaminase C-terminal domain-containing protein [Syntrophorhabdaceae bacterium]
MKKETLRMLLDTAKGLLQPDCVIKNGRIINVFTNTIEEGLDVVIKGGRVVSIERYIGDGAFCNQVKEIDVDGMFLCPGFIDAHTHIDGMIPFGEFTRYAIKGGTTTVVTETSAAACACGIAGVNTVVESTKGSPMRCFFLAPPLTPPFPGMESSEGLSLKEVKALLRRKDFVGLGEAYWTRIVEGDDRVLSQAAYALTLNKALDGHSAGARGRNLVQYVLTGITSCHESISIDEALEKLRFGMYIMIRDGWVRKELDELSKIKDMDIDKRRVMLVSDVFDAVMLYEEGYLDSIVRKAIKLGFSPIEAIKMVTINPADYYQLRYLGAIAPLRFADILILKDLKNMSIDTVMVNGDIVWTGGKLISNIIPYNYPDVVQNSIAAEKITADKLMIKSVQQIPKIRVIEQVGQTITREIIHQTKTKNGFLENDIDNDIVSVAIINRNNSDEISRGFIKGTGIKDGAVATTLIWDTGNILTIGSDEKDMAHAVNRLIDLKGGTVIVRSEKIIYEFPMPVFGIVPLASLEEIRDKTKELDARMKEIGSLLERPFLTIQTIPFTGLPFLRITSKGLVDIRNKRLVSLFV